jgi:hypothetical protein
MQGQKGERASGFPLRQVLDRGLAGDEVTGPSRAPTSSPASPHSAKAVERVKAGAWASARPAMVVEVDDSTTAM